jgi:hypothetical protein
VNEGEGGRGSVEEGGGGEGEGAGEERGGGEEKRMFLVRTGEWEDAR